MSSILFASHNSHKAKEIASLLPPHLKLITLSDLNYNEDIPETGITLKENALIKAKFSYQKFNCNCFADDSGLEVEILNNEPGVYSARFAGPQKNDDANMEKLLNSLEDIKNRTARFKTVIAFIFDGKEYFFEGIINGKITYAKCGTNGFGYDPIFIPDGYTKTFAEMSSEEKNSISHRAIAVKKLIEFLINIK
jgi:XTP/dITP diphosphohydrolase